MYNTYTAIKGVYRVYTGCIQEYSMAGSRTWGVMNGPRRIDFPSSSAKLYLFRNTANDSQQRFASICRCCIFRASSLACSAWAFSIANMSKACGVGVYRVYIGCLEVFKGV